MYFIEDFNSDLILDENTFKPYNEISFRLNPETVQESRSILQEDEIAKILGKQLLKAIAESNKKQIDEGLVGKRAKVAAAKNPVDKVSDEPQVPQVAKFSVITKIARQVEGEYVFIDVVKAHKNTEKLKKYLEENELPRTEVFGETPCVIEYGVLEDIQVEVD